MKNRSAGALALAAYVGCIVAANWAIHKFGFVPVGFGLLAPAGTYFAGAVFVARDAVQLTLGRWWALVAIVVGAGLSFATSPSLAIASGTAFLVGELVDWSIFTPLRRRHVVAGYLIGNTWGLLVDSWLFLYLAFGSVAHWQGLALGKFWMTAAFLPVLWVSRRRLQQPQMVAA
jgi:hypothetical protein